MRGFSLEKMIGLDLDFVKWKGNYFFSDFCRSTIGEQVQTNEWICQEILDYKKGKTIHVQLEH